MLRFAKTLALVLPLVALTKVPQASAQTQTTVKVDDGEYTVTAQMRGRMFLITTPDGRTAMIMPTASGYNIVSPPNGIYNGVDYKPQIAKIWKAYQDQKTGTSTTPAPAPSTEASPNDPNAARRAQVEIMIAQAQARVAGSGAKEIAIDHLTDDGAVINDPKLGMVTVSENGMKFTWTVAPNGAKPAYYTAEFEGGEKEAGAGAKTGKVIKGFGTALGDSLNTHANAASSITTNTDVWRVREEEGKIKTLVYESGGMRTGGYIAATGRDPIGRRGEDMLFEISRIYELAKQQIATAKQAGKAIAFDSSTDRVKRGESALQNATKD
jgi:hypothetical protein